MKLKPKTRRLGWLTRNEISHVWGFSITYFDRAVRPGLPAEAVRREKSRVYFDGAVVRAVLELRREKLHDQELDRRDRQISELRAAALGSGEDAELYAGESTPALERLRMARAQLAELQLEQRREHLLERDAVRRTFEVIAGHIRRGIETLQRQFGRDAHATMTEALDDAERALDEELGARSED